MTCPKKIFNIFLFSLFIFLLLGRSSFAFQEARCHAGETCCNLYVVELCIDGICEFRDINPCPEDSFNNPTGCEYKNNSEMILCLEVQKCDDDNCEFPEDPLPFELTNLQGFPDDGPEHGEVAIVAENSPTPTPTDSPDFPPGYTVSPTPPPSILPDSNESGSNNNGDLDQIQGAGCNNLRRGSTSSERFSWMVFPFGFFILILMERKRKQP